MHKAASWAVIGLLARCNPAPAPGAEANSVATGPTPVPTAAPITDPRTAPVPATEANPGPETTAGLLHEEPVPLALEGSASTSMGSPTQGHLVQGVPLPLRGVGFRFNPRKDPARRHGTVELVSVLVRASAAVARQHPGSTLVVGDLSLPEGGPIDGHASHRSGRDVDVMFYLLNHAGTPFPGKAIPLEPDGTGVDYRDLTTADDDVPVRLDVRRTWAFVAALVTDPHAQVARIFVVEHVRAMLLAHGAAARAEPALLARVGHLMCQPKFPHDDHMHIRVFCSPDDIQAGCLDTAPVYPWQRDFLRRHGARPVLAGRSTPRKPKLTSVDDAATQAREKLGEFAPEVDAFLQRRKTWAKKPRTGRKYCR